MLHAALRSASELYNPKHPPFDHTLLDRFHSQFRVVPANTLERVRIAQRVRFQVYCIENPHEKCVDPNGLESDEYDAHAVHSLLIHRASDTALGTVRLILPLPDAPGRSFAVQRIMDVDALSEFQRLPLRTMGEVSRFSISRQFRRAAEASVGAPFIGNSGPLMRLGLIQALVQMSAHHGITHWCAAMEPTLLRMLAAMGIRFRPVGPLVEYHGIRQPCYCVVSDILKSVRDERPTFWSVLTDGPTYDN
jgi:N-acyl amino acid synthase of PEP-CTERM/exosortase system